MRGKGVVAAFGAAAGLGAGLVAQRAAVQRRRRNDPEAAEDFGSRRGQRSTFIDTPDGARLFVEETGPESDKAAIFLHGSCMRTDLWYYQLAGLGGHRLIFCDLRGHGLSQPKGRAPYSVETLAADLALLIRENDLKQVVIVGHSVGGMIALQLCKDHLEELGDTLRGVVILNSTSRPAVETLLGGATVSKIERVVRRPLDALGSRADYVERLRQIIKPSDAVFMAVSVAAFGPQASAKQIDFTYDMLAETPADVMFDLLKAYRDYDVTEDLEDVLVPCLIVGGTHDRITVSGASEQLALLLPKAELKVLDRCGHMSMLERHREVNRLLERFFNDNLGRPVGMGEA
ncbi:MAG: alpha/beta fold hydrolase [Actinomycetota bacterium]